VPFSLFWIFFAHIGRHLTILDFFWLFGTHVRLFRFFLVIRSADRSFSIFSSIHRAADICASNLAIRRNRAI